MKYLSLLLILTGCSSSGKNNIKDYEKYKKSENYYQGYLNEGNFKSYVKVLWTVDGTGRAIDAKIQLPEDGRIVTQRIWSYDSVFEWRRNINHKKMMLDALEWVK